jgi:hypothetical protein
METVSLRLSNEFLHERNRVVLDNETRAIREILISIILDSERTLLAPTGINPRKGNRYDSSKIESAIKEWDYIHATNDENPFSFENTCHLLGYHPDHVRSRLYKRILEKGGEELMEFYRGVRTN